MTRVYLSLGSNIEPEKNLRDAVHELREKFGEIVASPTYRFPAVGFEGPDFLNSAVAIETDMSANDLNAWLHALEDRHGRRREGPRFSSRTLDIDIVLYGDAVITGPGHLEIPRKELLQAFVMQPLADIAPEAMHPTLHRTIGDLWKSGMAQGDVGAIVAP